MTPWTQILVRAIVETPRQMFAPLIAAWGEVKRNAQERSKSEVRDSKLHMIEETKE